MRNELGTLTAASIDRESEKAFYVAFESARRDGSSNLLKVWLPKSLTSVSGLLVTAPKWLFNEKLDNFTIMMNLQKV